MSVTEWNGRTRPTGKVLGTIVVTIVIIPEDGIFAGVCEALDIASQGDTFEEAHNNILEAVECYLESLDAHGEREQVLAERGVLFFPGEPPPDFEFPSAPLHPGEFVTAERVSVSG